MRVSGNAPFWFFTKKFWSFVRLKVAASVIAAPVAPPDALRCSLVLAVVRTKVSSPPSADIAFALAEAIYKQLANAGSAD
jgi:hypothetical protein